MADPCPKVRVKVHRAGLIYNELMQLQRSESLQVLCRALKAYPRQSGESSSAELTAKPPQARLSRSMFLFFARLRPRMPSLASRSRLRGSMPFWLITTKLSPSLQTCDQTSTMALMGSFNTCQAASVRNVRSKGACSLSLHRVKPGHTICCVIGIKATYPMS